MITVFAGTDRCFTRFRQVPLFHPTTLLVRPACSIQSEFTFALHGLLRPQTFCHPLLFFAVWCSISASRRKRSLTSRSHWTPSWYSGKSRGPLWWPSRRSGTAPQSMQSWARRYNNNNVCDWVCVHTACHLTYRSHKTFEHLTFFFYWKQMHFWNFCLCFCIWAILQNWGKVRVGNILKKMCIFPITFHVC